jgi:hypothetical protein
MSIIQIVSAAQETYAVYDDATGKEIETRVLCWGLTDNGAVVGLVQNTKATNANLLAADHVQMNTDNHKFRFYRYVAPGVRITEVGGDPILVREG